MKQYISDQSGMKVVEGINMEKSQKIDKSITQYGGEADLKWLHGCRLWVDKDDVVTKGPEPMIGRKYTDLAALTYADVFTVERSVMRALAERTKSYNPDDEGEATVVKSIMDDVNKFIDAKIASNTVSRYNTDPLYR